MSLMKRFWNDEAGVIISSELLLVMTILVIGMITGLATLQESAVNELGDTASAIGALDQSYAFTGTANAGSGGASTASTAGSTFNDLLDLGDEPDTAGGDAGNGVQVDLLPAGPEGQ
jgi:hypothetical protein